MSVNLSTAGNTTTGAITSTGLGSGLDINSIVTAVVNAAIQPQQTRLQASQATDQSTISALGTVKSTLASLQTAVNAITTGGALTQLSAQTSSSAVFTATAGSGAVAGTYQVKVQTLAQANTIQSTAFASASAAVGTGPYAITAGGKTFSVTLDSGNDTLSGLAAAINGAGDNSGVSATVINATGGSYLLLSATQTGVDNAVSVSSSAPVSFTTVQGAADATGTIANLPFQSGSNIVSNVLTGVSLNLVSASPDTTQTLTVTANTQSAANAVQAFVSAYNAAVSLLGSATAYTPGSGSSAGGGTAGPLLGDVAISSLQFQLQAITGAGNSAGNGFTLLSQIGVSANADGTLAVNGAKLASALQSNSAGVKSLFTGTGGIGTQLDTLLNNAVGAGGTIETETQSLQSQVDAMASQLTALTARQTQLTAQYYAQFNAMDRVVAGYKNTSSLLTQLYAPRPLNSSGSSG